MMKLYDVYDEKKLRSILREARTDIPGLEDLLASGIPFMVVGAVARNFYANRPRNTQDVDVLSADYNKLAEYIHITYPHLEMRQNDVVIRFSYEGEEIIDVVIPYNKFFESVLTDTRKAGRFDIPSPEALIAMKFAALSSGTRSLERKYQDRGDIGSIMLKNQIDINKINQHLSKLYPEAQRDFYGIMLKLKEDFGIL